MKILILFSFLFFSIKSISQDTKLLTLKGTFWDDSTGYDLPTRLYGSIKGKRIFLGQTNKNNQFDLPVKTDIDSLIFVSKGFHEFSTPVYFYGSFKKKTVGNIVILAARIERKLPENNYLIYCASSTYDNKNKYLEVHYKQNVFHCELERNVLVSKGSYATKLKLPSDSRYVFTIKNTNNEVISETDFEHRKGLSFLDTNTQTEQSLKSKNTELQKVAIAENKAILDVNQNVAISEQKNITNGIKKNFPEKINDKLGTQILFFEQSSYELSAENKTILENISKYLTDNPKTKIKIRGFTDNIGDSKLNEALAEFRAKVVNGFIVSKGIDQKKILVEWEKISEINTAKTESISIEKQRKVIITELL